MIDKLTTQNKISDLMAFLKSKMNYPITGNDVIRFVVLFLFIIPAGLYGQGFIKGRIIDSKTNLPVFYADIASKDKTILIKTNSKGDFLFSALEYPVTLKIRKTGYKDETIVVNSPERLLPIALIPIEINKKYLSNKSTLTKVLLLKKALEKLQINAPMARPDLAQKELVYCRMVSMADSTPESFYESYSYMNVNKYSLKGYQSAASRYATTGKVIPGIQGNILEFKIDPFIKLPFFVERYINRTGSFDQNGNRIEVVGFDMGATETIYYINASDTAVIFIKKRTKSKIRSKLQGSLQTWLDNRNTSTEISFSRVAGSRSGYQIDYCLENEAFRLVRKKKPDQIISKSVFFALIPDSSLIHNEVKKYVLKEASIEAKRQINFNSKFSLSAKTSLFNSETQKLFLKAYYQAFWAQNTLIRPDSQEQKQIHNWENDNRFYSENRLSPANEIIGVDSLVKIMNSNIVSIENVYLETDRPYYLTGDTIWFSAFVLDNMLIDSTSISKILYVDLINSENILEKHIKLFIRNGRSKGDFVLNKDLRNGIFRIRAYTQWMRNFQDEYYFEKEIPVYRSNINNLITVDPVINKSDKGDSVSLYLQALLPSGHKALEKHLDVFIRLNDSMSVRRSFSFKDDFHGSMGFFVPAALSCTSADLKITLSDTAFISEQRLSFPLKSGINIQFFPESGKMVAGIETVIAFKAIDNKGDPMEFDADIVDANQKIVRHIRGNKSGVGKFDFTPHLNRIYKAVVTLSGNKYVCNLPVTEPTGYLLTFNSDSSSIFIKNNQVANKNKHYLLVSVRGAIYTSAEARLSTGTIKIHLPFETYPKGIVQITLFDSLFRPLAERLVFNNRPDQRMIIHVETDKKEYRPREKVNLKVYVTDAYGNPVESSLSMAVTDASKTDSIKYSSCIGSYLFLASELKGKIDYSLLNLADTTPLGKRNIDLVMMTQGWRNYLWNSIRYNNSISDLYPIEKGFYLDGNVFSYNYRRPGSDYKLNFFDNKNGFNDIVKVDEKSHFKIDFPLFYDSHILAIQNRNKKNKIDEISFSLDTFPVPEINYRNNELPYISLKPGYLRTISEKFAEKDFANEQNIKYILIPEIVVKARSRIWYSKPDIAVNLEKKDPTGKKYNSLFQMITEEFGDKAFSDGVGNNCSPILILNDTQYDLRRVIIMGDPEGSQFLTKAKFETYSWALARPVNEISNVKFYEAGSDYSKFCTPPLDYGDPTHWIPWPVVSLTSYANFFRGNSVGTIILPFQGIYKAREFYQPDYEHIKMDKADNRTTVYWNPEIKTDSTGKANVTFYNSDLKGNALIRISGVSYQLKDASTAISQYLSHQ